MKLRIEFLFLCWAACSPALASDPPVQKSSDDALRDSLDAHSGNDYDRALLGEPDKAAANKNERGNEELDKMLKRQLGPAAPWEDQPQSRLVSAAKGMRDVQARLAQGKSDAITQVEQRQVVADLQKIIDEAKKSGKCLGQSCAGGNGKTAGKLSDGQSVQIASKPREANDTPARNSNPNAPRQAAAARIHREQAATDTMQSSSGIQLQSRSPDTKYQLPGEHFLPEYEREIEDYFGRMSGGTLSEH